ncbi:GGDEF domain-containing protein [Cupriavidus gilardii]|uniref:GGDEF domain-containing protein n=1 Tax=Cupriavidus gilardii TaxID=82541 RepID=UPI001573DEF3|nr:GGDEF domain-containing protein [Cupriavidus gilardii]MCG5258861.1 GGDEF domain-containing protein [Cupriavidus gilardii]MDF9429023.1 GGDEF domain-containing protein [Cupriavidus gilardii]NSX05714.1 GGDEF domain-containing protein [Cupriavidus gilardii]
MSPDLPTAYLTLLVLFASTLGISIGLRYGAAQAGHRARWTDAHAFASLGGMALALGAIAPAPLWAVLAQALCLAAQLMLVRGLAASGMAMAPHHLRAMVAGGVASVALLGLIATVQDAVMAERAIRTLGHAITALVVWQALRLLNRERRSHTIGHALVWVACCAQLAAQCLCLALALAAGGAGAWSPLRPDEPGMLAQAPLLLMLIAVLSGVVGFTLLSAERQLAEQRDRARLDSLTGLFHRGALDDAAMTLAGDAARSGKPLSCLVIDVDRFKQVNDRAGHQAGDQVLVRIAETLRRACRASDVAARFGGEEFCLLCPNTGEEEAVLLAERIRARIAAIALPEEVGGHASVSIGIALAEDGAGAGDARRSWERLFAEADRALYRAKREGRNRVIRAAAGTGMAASAANVSASTASKAVNEATEPAAWRVACGVSVGG